MYALVNCDIYTGTGVEYDKALVINNDRIDGLVPLRELGAGIARRDLKGLSVAPGFIDVQVNGGGGILFNDAPSIDGIKTIAEAHRHYGTTNILPTYITGPNDGMRQAAEAVRRCIETRR